MQTRQLTLYVDGYFTNVWDASCFVALTEKGLEFSVARALLQEGQGIPAALLGQTAIARVPALQHGELWLTESLAIIEYLEEMFPAPHYPRLLPTTPQARARTRQIMMWLRSDMLALREERPWQQVVYPRELAPMSRAAAREASELVDLVVRLDGRGELEAWTIAHADLAFALMRLEGPLPEAAQRLRDANRLRASIRGYVEHGRPPNPPPKPRS